MATDRECSECLDLIWVEAEITWRGHSGRLPVKQEDFDAIAGGAIALIDADAGCLHAAREEQVA